MEIKYGHCCGSREESEYGIPSATSVSQLCNALGSQELLVLSLLCSCGPSPAVLVHLVVTLLCWVWWGSVLKSLYVPTTCQEVVSQRLGSHHHFLMPDIPNKFPHLYVCAFHFASIMVYSENVKLKSLPSTASNIRGPLCAWDREAGFPGSCPTFFFCLYSNRLASLCIPVCLMNYFPLSVLLSSLSNKSVLSHCLLNAAEAFFPLGVTSSAWI